jgi:hypothetical protein
MLTLDEKVKWAMRGLAAQRWLTPYAAAKALGMSRKTLERRMSGGKSRTQAREVQQMLTKSEEKVLGKWITHLTATGHPARHEFIRDMAEEIRRRRGIQEDIVGLPLGVTWVQRFIKRNPHLKTVISRSIEAARIKEVTSEVVSNFFDALKTCMDDYQITMENVYNMDETGIICHCYQANCRLCNWCSTDFICGSGFPPSKEISGTTWTAGMGHRCGMYLCRRKFYCTLDHF